MLYQHWERSNIIFAAKIKPEQKLVLFIMNEYSDSNGICGAILRDISRISGYISFDLDEIVLDLYQLKAIWITRQNDNDHLQINFAVLRNLGDSSDE